MRKEVVVREKVDVRNWEVAVRKEVVVREKVVVTKEVVLSHLENLGSHHES